MNGRKGGKRSMEEREAKGQWKKGRQKNKVASCNRRKNESWFVDGEPLFQTKSIDDANHIATRLR